MSYRRVALCAVCAALVLVFGLVGCNGESDRVVAGLLLAGYTGNMTILNDLKAEREAAELDAMILKFARSSTSAKTYELAEFYCESSVDVALSMEGTVTPRAAGVTVALQDRVPSADPTRAVTLDLANPGTDGKLTGTITYTRNDVTYQGDVSFSPADQIWP